MGYEACCDGVGSGSSIPRVFRSSRAISFTFPSALIAIFLIHSSLYKKMVTFVHKA